MASIEKRIEDLVEKHLGITDRAMLDVNGRELGVSSTDTVNFLKIVNREFNVDILPGDAAKFSKLRDLIDHLKTIIP